MSLSIDILQRQVEYMIGRIEYLENRTIIVNDDVIHQLKESVKELQQDIDLLKSSKDNKEE